MSNEIEKVYCECCESQYKIVYQPENASGLPKFCCFCGSELFDNSDDSFEDDKE
jgi:hypothetical protein